MAERERQGAVYNPDDVWSLLPGDCEMECTNPRCVKRIMDLEEQLQRVKSVGYDMLKQRGVWQLSGQSPTNVSLDFNNVFDHEVEDIAKCLQKDGHMEEDLARVKVCEEFQKIHETCKELIFKKLSDTLYKAFLIGSDQDSDEQLYDICRAYGLLLHASGLLKSPEYDKLAAKAKADMKSKYEILPDINVDKFSQTVSKLSWDIFTVVPPMVSAEPCSNTFYKAWHEKEMSPTWNSDLVEYELVYYRPILFVSCEGMVARRGWVGNRVSNKTAPKSPRVDRKMCSTDTMLTSETEMNTLSAFKPKGGSCDLCGESCDIIKESRDHQVTRQHWNKPRRMAGKLSQHSYSSKSRTGTDSSASVRGLGYSSVSPSKRQVLGSQPDMSCDQQYWSRDQQCWSRDQTWRTNYVHQRVCHVNKDRDNPSPENDSVVNNSADIWTGESMWRIRP